MDVEAKLKTPRLQANGLDGTDIAIAIADMGINLAHLKTKLGTTPRLDAEDSFVRPGVVTQPGQHPVAHGTKCAYDALIAAPKATLLDYCILDPAGTSLGATLNNALHGYARLAHLLADKVVGPALGGATKFKGLVISNSWGVVDPDEDFPPGHPGRYIDNPHHPFQRQVAMLAGAGADIVFAAGNCGADCPNPNCHGRTTGTIMGANASADVLTLAGCDINDKRVGYSSQGPSIANMPPHKPDLTAYTHFLGSEVQVGKPDDGTSASSPVAAGCVAALRTKASPFKTSPVTLFEKMMNAAWQVVGPAGWNKDFGHGIIDPLGAAQNLGIPIA
jgi:hypothetical protein